MPLNVQPADPIQEPGPNDLSVGDPNRPTPPAAPSNLDPSGVSPAEQAAVNPNLGPTITADNAWQQYAVQAVTALYPRLRNGVDFAIGRNSLDGDVELLSSAEGITLDWGKVQEEARAMADRDPYAVYEPKPSLSPQQAPVGTHGEMPPPPTY